VSRPRNKKKLHLEEQSKISKKQVRERQPTCVRRDNSKLTKKKTIEADLKISKAFFEYKNLLFKVYRGLFVALEFRKKD